jgi:hypothetical protein
MIDEEGVRIYLDELLGKARATVDSEEPELVPRAVEDFTRKFEIVKRGVEKQSCPSRLQYRLGWATAAIREGSDAMDESLRDYRKVLVEADQQSQEQFDRTLIALSGGALGISMSFVDKFIGSRTVACPHLLLNAWLLWTLSLVIVLFSFALSRRALRHMIRQIDKGVSISDTGKDSRLTQAANLLAPLSFIAGTILMEYSL